MFTVRIPSSCASWQLIMDGWLWASTILKLAEAELPLKVILRVEVLKVVKTQVSAPVSTFIGMERVSLILIVLMILSG